LDYTVEKTINRISDQMLRTTHASELTYPSIDVIIALTEKIKTVLFSDYYGNFTSQCIRFSLFEIYDLLHRQIELVVPKTGTLSGNNILPSEISIQLMDELPHIRQALIKDAQFGFDSDPAAQSVDEVILSYPGFYAVFVYRLAHALFLNNVPILPRMMTEHAHSKTGIDIHPGAEIGEHFFIDHGTGVVIGETTVIGRHVKIYQGVTLGALSLKKGQKLAGLKRHPTLEDNVTIYSGASILGGDTVVGKNSTVSGNAFITASISQDTKA